MLELSIKKPQGLEGIIDVLQGVTVSLAYEIQIEFVFSFYEESKGNCWSDQQTFVLFQYEWIVSYFSMKEQSPSIQTIFYLRCILWAFSYSNSFHVISPPPPFFKRNRSCEIPLCRHYESPSGHLGCRQCHGPRRYPPWRSEGGWQGWSSDQRYVVSWLPHQVLDQY